MQIYLKEPVKVQTAVNASTYNSLVDDFEYLKLWYFASCVLHKAITTKDIKEREDLLDLIVTVLSQLPEDLLLETDLIPLITSYQESPS